MKSGHDEIKDMLHGYLHGTLTKDASALVKDHLSCCDECADEFYIAGELLKIEAPDPGVSYYNNLTKAVLDTASVSVANRFNLWKYLFRPVPIAAAVSLCLIIFILSFGIFHSGHIQYAMQNNITMDAAASDEAMYSLLEEEEYGDGLAADDSGDDLTAML
ncbi:MAG: zf-HC2 domain-containing protein [Nitrospirae bacterium]|nr:zf-HC2 domain-containing protein [Nitrospirota bacterium]